MKEFSKIRFVSYLLVIVLSISCFTCGCGKKKVKPKDSLEEEVQTALYDKGISMVETLLMLSRDSGYVSNIGLVSSMQSQYNKILDCPYEKLTDVYRVSHLSDATDTFVDIAGQEMSNATVPYFKDRIVEEMADMIISYSSGVAELSLSSVLRYETCFINKSLTTSEAYIYCYKDSYPILITFIPGDDGAIKAQAIYLVVDKMINMEPEDLAKCVRGYFNATSLEPIYK